MVPDKLVGSRNASSVWKAYVIGRSHELKVMHNTYTQATNSMRRKMSTQGISGGKEQTPTPRELLDRIEIQQQEVRCGWATQNWNQKVRNGLLASHLCFFTRLLHCPTFFAVW